MAVRAREARARVLRSIGHLGGRVAYGPLSAAAGTLRALLAAFGGYWVLRA
jgi:hypothetical protein